MKKSENEYSAEAINIADLIQWISARKSMEMMEMVVKVSGRNRSLPSAMVLVWLREIRNYDTEAEQHVRANALITAERLIERGWNPEIDSKTLWADLDSLAREAVQDSESISPMMMVAMFRAIEMLHVSPEQLEEVTKVLGHEMHVVDAENPSQAVDEAIKSAATKVAADLSGPDDRDSWVK